MAARPESPARAVARRQLLLAVLADDEAVRLAEPATPAQVDAMARWYRARHELLRRRDLEAFLTAVGLREEVFVDQMRSFANVAAAQHRHMRRIEALTPRYRAVFGVRDWLVERETPAAGATSHDHP
jgi:hypothetical protein